MIYAIRQHSALFCSVLDCLDDLRIIPGAVLAVQQSETVFRFVVVPDKALDAVFLGSAEVIAEPCHSGGGVLVLVDAAGLVNDDRNALADKGVVQVLECGVQFLLIAVAAPVGTGVVRTAEIPRRIDVQGNDDVVVLGGRSCRRWRSSPQTVRSR